MVKKQENIIETIVNTVLAEYVTETKIHDAVVYAMAKYSQGKINAKKANKALLGWFNDVPKK